MSLRAHVALAILVALAIVGIIVLVRRRHLKAKYSLLWLSLGAVMVVIAAVPGLLDWTAERLGIWYQPTLLILLGLALLLLIVVHFSYELTRSENRTRERFFLARQSTTHAQERSIWPVDLSALREDSHRNITKGRDA